MSYEIPVFRAEADAGLSARVRSDASLAYLTAAEPYEPPDALRRAAASVRGVSDPDLFFMRDVLASSVWNGNDDVMLPAELWAARHTCDDKPLNVEHDQNDIVGHVVGSEAVDASLAPLGESLAVEDLPALFHVLNGSVLYRNVGDAGRVARVEAVVAGVNAGGWFVSMECYFRGFDYALGSPGSYEVVPRNEATAGLTRCLRAYGGTGVLTGPGGVERRVGRVLRTMTFCGKGLVRRPANPDSVILTAGAVYEDRDPVPVSENQECDSGFESEVGCTKAGSTIPGRVPVVNGDSPGPVVTPRPNLRTADMPETDNELRDRLAASEEARASLTEQVAAKDGEIAGLHGRVGELEARASALESDAAEMKSCYSAARDDLAAAEAGLAAAKAAATLRTRVDVLRGMGHPKPGKLAESLKALDDDAFAAAAAEMVGPAGASDAAAVADAVPEADAALAAADEGPDRSTAVTDFYSTNVLRTPRGRGGRNS